MKIKIALLPGDGIGPEITETAVELIKLIAERYNLTVDFSEQLVGGASIDEFGEPLTEQVLEECYDADAVLLGAVGGEKWENLQHHLKPEAGLLKLRKSLGLYANIRPAKIYPAFIDASSLKADVLTGTDFVVLRELTGGIYFGEPRGYDESRGWNTMSYTKEEVDRIVDMAFMMAKERSGKLMSVDKANVLEVSQFWRSRVNEIKNKYPEIVLHHMYVDNAAMQIVRDPTQFDVIVTSNLFGDILSDIAGMITGSLGMLPSASIGDRYAMYEPVHGSAPDIAGKDMANPIAMLSSVAMMFNHSFQMTKAAEIVEKAIERSLGQGYRTQDIYSDGKELVSLSKMSDIILNNVEEIMNEQAIGVFTL
jgi:3-isopropylmalate dehydrogenase